MKILITGQNGFLGYHLYNTIKYKYPNYQLLEFNKQYFNDENQLSLSLDQADVIIHFAGLNRHENDSYVLKRNQSSISGNICMNKSGNIVTWHYGNGAIRMLKEIDESWIESAKWDDSSYGK